MKTRIDLPEISFRIVVYPDASAWLAHALEADLVGHGDTEQAAIDDLAAALECQISFALQMGDLSLIDKPAPKAIFALWETVHKANVAALIPEADGRPAKPLGTKRQAAAPARSQARYFGFTRREIDALRNRRLEPVLG